MGTARTRPPGGRMGQQLRQMKPNAEDLLQNDLFPSVSSPMLMDYAVSTSTQRLADATQSVEAERLAGRRSRPTGRLAVWNTACLPARTRRIRQN